MELINAECILYIEKPESATSTMVYEVGVRLWDHRAMMIEYMEEVNLLYVLVFDGGDVESTRNILVDQGFTINGYVIHPLPILA